MFSGRRCPAADRDAGCRGAAPRLAADVAVNPDDLDRCSALSRLDLTESCGRQLGTRKIRDAAVRRKRKRATPSAASRSQTTAGCNIRRIALAFEAGRDGFWLDLWRLILFRKIPEYPVSGTDGSNPSSSNGESATFSRRFFKACRRSSGRCNWLYSRMKYQRCCVKHFTFLSSRTDYP